MRTSKSTILISIPEITVKFMAPTGFPKTEPGGGSFWNSDFHHNGDIGDYNDPWQNHLGKIYGIMDDLRNEHPRVQDKLIAMTDSLISSTDIDGIRMDTPMQVPLSFFKRWAPAVKAHARSLGKNNFFIFGEFYCSRERSATMVGRGHTPAQWGNHFSFIDNSFAMDAGVNYRLYFDFFNPSIAYQADGVHGIRFAMDAFEQDMNAYDFYNPDRKSTNYVMLNFFDNHDQWRMSVQAPGDSFRKSALASAIIAFWPGLPLFYYGDEQELATIGPAINGPSREDFMTSKAVRSAEQAHRGRFQPGGVRQVQYDPFRVPVRAETDECPQAV